MESSERTHHVVQLIALKRVQHIQIPQASFYKLALVLARQCVPKVDNLTRETKSKDGEQGIGMKEVGELNLRFRVLVEEFLAQCQCSFRFAELLAGSRLACLGHKSKRKGMDQHGDASKKRAKAENPEVRLTGGWKGTCRIDAWTEDDRDALRDGMLDFQKSREDREERGERSRDRPEGGVGLAFYRFGTALSLSDIKLSSHGQAPWEW